MPLLHSDIDIWYEVVGSGPDVVLLHPFPAHHGIWGPVAERLAGHYRLILPDLRGHGSSGVGAGPATMARHAADLVRLCDELGVRKAVFAGESIGGYILFEFWRRHRERVRALALCNTRAQADTPEGRAARLKAAAEVEKTGPEPFLDSMIPRLLGETTRRNRPDVEQAAREMMRKSSAPGIAAVQRGMAERPDSVPTLALIDAPTLILAGEEDILIPQADSELMQRGIAGSRLRVVPKAGHYAVFEQPEAAGALLREFLDHLPR